MLHKISCTKINKYLLFKWIMHLFRVATYCRQLFERANRMLYNFDALA